jgi:hypothetical protein
MAAGGVPRVVRTHRWSPYPENRRRRLRRALRRLLLDRDDFLAKYPRHTEANRIYERERARVEAEILATYTLRWRKRLAAQAA